MNFVPRIISANCAEAVILLPDSGIEITFRSIAKYEMSISDMIEVSRIRDRPRLERALLISAPRLQVARRMAAEAVIKNRQDMARRQRERFSKPLQLSLGIW